MWLAVFHQFWILCAIISHPYITATYLAMLFLLHSLSSSRFLSASKHNFFAAF